MDQAIGLLTNVLKANDEYDVLWITLSGLYERSNNIDKALWAAENGLNQLNKLNNRDDKISYANDVIQKLQSKRSKSDDSVKPEITKALLDLERCERENFKQKQHADAIKRLIQIYLNDGNKHEALHYCDKLIEITNYITDFGNKAIVMSYFGDSSGAIKLLHDILREKPHLDSLWYILSDIYEKSGDRDAAFKCAYNCKKALLQSSNPNPQNIADIEAKLTALR